MDPSPVAKLFVLPVNEAGHLLFEKFAACYGVLSRGALSIFGAADASA
jgi:hypothetical protein